MAQVLEMPGMDESLKATAGADTFSWGGWPDDKWWKLFQDPQLDRLIAKALDDSPTLKVARYKVKAAEQGAKKIRSKLFPALSAGYDENWEYYSKNGFVRDFYPILDPTKIPSKVNQLDFSLNFNYEFDFWGKNRKMFKSAIGLARAQRAERAQASLTLCSAIAFAYFEMQTHWTELNLREKALKLKEKKLDLCTQRSEVGIESDIPYYDAEKDVFAARQKVAESKKKLLLDQYVLKKLIGSGPDFSLELEYRPVAFERAIPLPEHLDTDLLARRPDVIALIWQAESASHNIGVAKTEFYPNVNLAAIGGLESLSFSKFLNWDSRTGSLQPAVHLPLFLGGKLRANLAEKVALFNEAVESYNEKVLEAVREVVSEVATLQSLEIQIGWQKKMLLEQEKKDNLKISRFKRGLDNLLSVIDSEMEIIEEQLQEASLQNYKLLALVKLIRALGGGYHADHAVPEEYKR